MRGKQIAILLLALVVAILLSGCEKKANLDAAKYRQYICFDSKLACIDAGNQSVREYITFSEGDSYYFIYRRAEDVSDDQFVCVTMKDAFPLSVMKSYIFQNPENPIDVWTDWTIKEIQVYYVDINQSVSRNKSEPAETPTKIVAIIQDEACLAQFLHFATGDEYRSISAIREDLDSVGNLSMEYDAYTNVYVRVIFHESETIVWDSEISCYRNNETGERYLSVYKDATAWDENAYYCGIDSKEFFVENLRDLESFLLNAVDAYFADIEEN